MSFRIPDIYANLVPVSDPATEAGNQAGLNPAPASNNTTPVPTAHVAISWIGVLIALILLRIVYEVSD